MEYLVPRDQAFDLYQRASRRLERMLSALTGRGVRPDTPVPHLEWTTGELVAHLVHGVEVAEDLQEGKSSPFLDMQHIAEVNARLLAERPERAFDALIPPFSRSIRRIEQRFAEMPDDEQVPFHGSTWFRPPQAMVMMSCELLIHGWDLAHATGEAFEIDPADARLMVYTMTPLLPKMVLADAANGFTATYEICLLDGACMRVHLEDGVASVSHVERGGPADCRITADATAFLLMGYGRGSQVMPILTGKVRVGGRKPWLALTFPKLFKNP